MDLLSITRTLWRHRLLTLPVLLATLSGLAYIIFVTAPTYNATADYLLVRPPTAPSPADLVNDPGLAHVSANNPYTRFDDQSVVVDILVGKLTADDEKARLISQGAGRQYSVALVAKFGSPTPIAEITGVGSTAAAAARSRQVVSDQFKKSLIEMQREQGVQDYYLIRTLQIGASGPIAPVSGRLRSLIGILALGVIGIFVVVTVADAIDKKRAESRAGQPDSADHASGEVGPWLTPGGRGTRPRMDGGESPVGDRQPPRLARAQRRRVPASVPVAPLVGTEGRGVHSSIWIEARGPANANAASLAVDEGRSA